MRVNRHVWHRVAERGTLCVVMPGCMWGARASTIVVCMNCLGSYAVGFRILCQSGSGFGHGMHSVRYTAFGVDLGFTGILPLEPRHWCDGLMCLVEISSVILGSV